jgi:hypothetical protein
MTERQMEDLIAEFPDDFFRGHGLTLKGRQQSFAEVGRFDLLFVDSFQTNVLMELKARTAKYEDASQLARYKDALQQRGEQNILMWLVATQVPNSVREFLDNIGIEYSEIHEAQFRNGTERHGIKLDLNPSLSAARAAMSWAYAMKRMYPQAPAEYDKIADQDKAVAAENQFVAGGLLRRVGLPQ